MHVSYDTIARATYVQLGTAEVANTIEVSDTVLVDVDASGEAVGVEFLVLPREVNETLVWPAVERFPELEVLLKSDAWLMHGI